VRRAKAKRSGEVVREEPRIVESQTTLVLEDPGGETLDRFLSEPMKMTQFLRLAVGLATALGGFARKGADS